MPTCLPLLPVSDEVRLVEIREMAWEGKNGSHPRKRTGKI